jgi:hypothetical protein
MDIPFTSPLVVCGMGLADHDTPATGIVERARVPKYTAKLAARTAPVLVAGRWFESDTVIARIWRRVVQDGDCMVFTGSLNEHGYGQITVNYTLLRVPREVAKAFHGPPTPAAPHALHSCDNPPCCNPAHLRWGTRSQNMQEMWDRQRRLPSTSPSRLAGEGSSSARLTTDQVLQIRARRAEGESFSALGREYGMARESIRKICLRLTWKLV